MHASIGKLDPSRRNAFVKKLKHYAVAGFWNYEGAKNPVRHEGDGVYRIGTKGDLFRMIGFYENNEKRRFIAVDAFLKSGTNLNASERRRIAEVARVRRDGDWRKKEKRR